MLNNFDYYLEKVGEIGFVEETLHSLAYVSGIPEAHPEEIVIFENSDLGQVFSISSEKVEVILLTGSNVRVGAKVVRTGEFLSFGVGEKLLGRMINPLGVALDGKGEIKVDEFRSIEGRNVKLLERRDVEKPLETGVGIVDLVVPLGKGQRELIIGDRKTGKTEFILQTILNQAQKGTFCIYCVIGQKLVDIKNLYKFFVEKEILDKVSIIATSSSDPSGLKFLTPYSGMTLAEYFCEKGKDVLIVLDDMTTHARTYREISLIAKRFPGRNSYPGDIFYIHAKLVERAGNFKNGSITCLPVAESVLGDISGFLQTNLMAMTDGHIFFDIDLYNEGKRPAVNPFLSVTRVGHQTQTPLQRDVSRQFLSFLVQYERMKEFLHFGAEVGEFAKNILSLGEKVDIFLNQESDRIVPIEINIVLLASLWAGVWNDVKTDDLKRNLEKIILLYFADESFQKEINRMVSSIKTFSDLVNHVKRNRNLILEKLGTV